MLLTDVYSLKVIFHAPDLVEIIVYVYYWYIIYVYGTKLVFHIENEFTGTSVYYIFVIPPNHKHQQTVQTLHYT